MLSPNAFSSSFNVALVTVALVVTVVESKPCADDVTVTPLLESMVTVAFPPV